MSRLELLRSERVECLQASGLAIALGFAQPGVSVPSVYRWKKLLAPATPDLSKTRASKSDAAKPDVISRAR